MLVTQWASRSLAFLAILVCVCPTSGYITDDFALELVDNSDIKVAKAIADKYGFDVIYHAQQLGNVYHLRRKKSCSRQSDLGKTNADHCTKEVAELSDVLSRHPSVLQVVHQMAEDVERKWLDPSTFWDSDSTSNVFGDSSGADERKVALAGDEEEDAKVYKRALAKRKLQLRFNDPHFPLQWYLMNVGQFKGVNPGLDLNLLPAWNMGFDGSGVVATVVDDGLDVRNPDLARWDPLASTDLNDPANARGVPIRSGNLSMKETHGTACAGEIGAAANNRFCGVGVAFNASLGGIRLLDGIVTDLLEAYAVLHNNQYIDIYSCSWGPKDNGWKMEQPKTFTARALKLGVERGRGGKGSIYVMASGNGGYLGDNCGADGFVNSPYTIAVAALNIYGKTPIYGESCSAIHVAAPVGGPSSRTAGRFLRPDPQVTTTMVNGGCFNKMSGTSAATPLVSGCIALALQANPRLTWRDVQHLLARSARLSSAETSGHSGWQMNGAGRLVSHHSGFGLLDCSRFVFNAQTWSPVPPQVVCEDARPFRGKFRVPAGRPLVLTFTTTGCRGSLTRLEHALVTLSMRGMRRGDTEVWLESPRGVKSRLLGPRAMDNDRTLGIRRQGFLSLMSWDEDPAGVWKLLVRDRSGRGGAQVTEAALRLTGTGGGDRPGGRSLARWLTSAEALAEFRRQRIASAQQGVLHPRVARLSAMLGEAALDGDDSGVDDKLARVVREAREMVAGGSGADSARQLTEFDLKFLLERIDAVLKGKVEAVAGSRQVL